VENRTKNSVFQDQVEISTVVGTHLMIITTHSTLKFIKLVHRRFIGYSQNINELFEVKIDILKICGEIDIFQICGEFDILKICGEFDALKICGKV
jgi:hypothetical protein